MIRIFLANTSLILQLSLIKLGKQSKELPLTVFQQQRANKLCPKLQQSTIAEIDLFLKRKHDNLRYRKTATARASADTQYQIQPEI